MTIEQSSSYPRGNSFETIDSGQEVTAATVDVQDLIDTIDATEGLIANTTNEEGQELVDTVDQFLVDDAERAADTHDPQVLTIAETVLVKGALEATGARPSGTENPIIQLENDGYGSVVTQGVGELYSAQAVLPDGQLASEVIATTVALYDEQTKLYKAETRPTISDELDTALQYFYGGASKEYIREKGFDPEAVTNYIRRLPEDEKEYVLAARRKARNQSVAQEGHIHNDANAQKLEAAYVYGIQSDSGLTESQLATWYESLSPDDQRYFAEAKKEMTDEAEKIKQMELVVKQNLETLTPELLEGRLPESLAKRIGSEYVLGLRQLGTFDRDDAQKELAADGGVAVSNLDLVQSFNVIKASDDSIVTAGTVIRGYYGVRGGGKYVIVIPTVETDTPTAAYNSIPDMRQQSLTGPEPNHQVVNPKYVAGFIDSEGIFHQNVNFMRSGEPMLSNESRISASTEQHTSNPYEKFSLDQLSTIRDNIADSVVQGIRRYDFDEVKRANINLAAIQREIEMRSPGGPAHTRGEMDGNIIYVTQPAPEIIKNIVDALQKFDGARDIARKMNGKFDAPVRSETDEATWLEAVELSSLLGRISYEIRQQFGEGAEIIKNPYASTNNVELAKIRARLHENVDRLASEGKDTTHDERRLEQISVVLRGRQ